MFFNEKYWHVSWTKFFPTSFGTNWKIFTDILNIFTAFVHEIKLETRTTHTKKYVIELKLHFYWQIASGNCFLSMFSCAQFVHLLWVCMYPKFEQNGNTQWKHLEAFTNRSMVDCNVFFLLPSIEMLRLFVFLASSRKFHSQWIR